jgi:hypothetical protein
MFADFLATDAAGSTCTFHLILNILDRNAAPAFNPTVYSGTVLESADTGTPILEVTATDEDIGDNGRLRFYLDDKSPSLAKVGTDSIHMLRHFVIKVLISPIFVTQRMIRGVIPIKELFIS